MNFDNLEYDPKQKAKYDWENYFAANKLANLAFKSVAVKLKTDVGNFEIGEGKFNFIAAKHKEDHPIKNYNFSRFTAGLTSEEDARKTAKPKFDYEHIDFSDENNEINPIQTDTTDATFEFDNENAIIVDLKNKKTE